MGYAGSGMLILAGFKPVLLLGKIFCNCLINEFGHGFLLLFAEMVKGRNVLLADFG